MEHVRKQIYISPDMGRSLKWLCSSEHVSESEVMRRALVTYFAQHRMGSEGDPLLKTIGLGTSQSDGSGSVNYDDIYKHVR